METVLLNAEKYKNRSEYSREKLDMAISDAIKKVDLAMETLGDDFASHHSVNGVYFRKDNAEGGWNQGFWTGILWIAYEFTNDEKYRNLAVKHITTFYKRIDEKLGVNHHDMGFCICRHASLHINFWAITLQKKQLSRRQIICFPDTEKRGSLFKCGGYK